MRRIVLFLTVVVLGVLLSAGVALAANIVGTGGADELIGTPNADNIYGLGGNDFISGRGEADHLYGGNGRDEVRGGGGDDYVDGDAGMDLLYGGDGDDTISATDSVHDLSGCGPGFDTLYADAYDEWNNSCEDVRLDLP